jgi:hypothetical protein
MVNHHCQSALPIWQASAKSGIKKPATSGSYRKPNAKNH